MKKKNNKGFMLVETLIVTVFVAGVLIYMFIQYSNLSENYQNTYKYNTVEKLYALEDVRDYILSDDEVVSYIDMSLRDSLRLDISNCAMFKDVNYCKKMFELENIDKIIITNNLIDKNAFSDYTQDIIDFVNKIKPEGKEGYRIIARFKDSTFATLRFGNRVYRPEYVDSTLNGADPQLGKLTPVIYDEKTSNWVVADTTTKWYDYSNQKWANAVLLKSGVSKGIGDTVTVPTSTSEETEVTAMFVWIPRYSYTISETAKGEITTDSYGRTYYLNPGAIDIKFIGTNTIENGVATYSGSQASGWYTHPAFWWDDNSNGKRETGEELTGIWVGKFETTGTKDNPTILPNLKSLTNQTVSEEFATSRLFETKYGIFITK